MTSLSKPIINELSNKVTDAAITKFEARLCEIEREQKWSCSM